MERELQPVPEIPRNLRDQIVRYLLGEVDDVERNNFDERLISMPEFSDTIASIEDELIMQYVRGDLDPRLVPRFNEIYLSSPAKLARVKNAQALGRAVREVSAERVPHTARSLQTRVSIAAVAAVVTLMAVLWPIWRRSPSDHGKPGKTSYVSFSLEPGITRSSEGAQIALPRDIDEVHFELAVPHAAALPTYDAVLGTPERPGAWKGVAASQNGHLIVAVPVKVLSAGDYALELQRSGKEVMTFYFRVAK
jgi:hypothetical protein